MVEQKLLKTKLCDLYRRGRCSRQSCSFAHGDSELRRFSKSFTGRQDYRVGDLREKIGRRRSPIHRHSPGRVARVSQGYNTPRSYGITRDRNYKKRESDGRSDIPRNLKISHSSEDQVNVRKAISSDPKEIYDEQLGHVRSEIQMLEEHKTRLQMYLEERVQEADILNSKTQELELQLCTERDKCERIITTTKKFIKAHKRHARLQKELLRSQAKLQKLGEQLSSDVVKLGPNEEDASINILSDGEAVANHVTSPQIESQKIASPSKKRQWSFINEGSEHTKQATSAEGEGAMQSEKRLRSNVHHAHHYKNKEAVVDGSKGWKLMTKEAHLKQGKNLPTDNPSGVKLKDSEMGLLPPSMSMGAHLTDEVETDGNNEVFENSSSKTEKGRMFPYQLPPPPPLPPNHYLRCLQHHPENENVDVDVDGPEEETVEVDII